MQMKLKDKEKLLYFIQVYMSAHVIVAIGIGLNLYVLLKTF